MRTIAIIGAGQAGLQLAIGLKQKRYKVKLFTNRSSEQIRTGKIMSSQGMFNSALAFERELGIDFWQQEAPQHKFATFTLVDPSKKDYLLQWRGETSFYYQSIDQRIKFSRWMEELERLGGEIVIDDIDINKLNNIAEQHELTIVASGKNTLSQLFPKNHLYSVFDKPPRNLSCLYVKNFKPENYTGVRVYVLPGVGEFSCILGLTHRFYSEMMLFEAVPGTDFDCWANVKNVNTQLNIALELLKKYIPYEAERFREAQPADNNASLIGNYTPIVRYPVSKMPCGKFVLGMGDAVILNDPIAGQGANNAAKSAGQYLKKIIEHGKNEFNKEWMQHVFEEHWHQDGKWATQLTNLLLNPPEPHVMAILTAAAKNTDIANKLANGFDNPSMLFPWLISNMPTEEFSFEYLIKKNQDFLEKYKKNSLMQLVYNGHSLTSKIAENILSGIQVLSNYFQKIVMLRSVFSEVPKFCKISQEHLEDEFGHHLSLMKDRKNKPSVWDAVLDATSAWFTWKMFVLDNEEKTVLIHLVLEASANVFFQQAHKVMKQYNETDYFKIHSEADEKHENMGKILLSNLPQEKYARLLEVQKQGWDVLNAACERIAEIAMFDRTES